MGNGMYTTNQSKSTAKSTEVNEIENKDQYFENAVLVTEESSPMLNLDVDCFEELFEWLSCVDLLALRQTCKRLQKVVDYFIKSNYPVMKIGYGKIGFHQTSYDASITVRSVPWRNFEKFQSDQISVKMIKEMDINVANLTDDKIDKFKSLLYQIEKFQIGTQTLSTQTLVGDFYELILKWCSNLKSLSIHNIRSDTVIGSDNQWLLHHYPLLEHVQLTSACRGFNGYQIEELKIFFELNPNIQVFSTTNNFLCGNANCFFETNIQIDRLDVKLYCDNESIYDANALCHLLNKLYEQGFYKRVHIYCRYIDEQRVMNQIGSIRGLKKLYLFQADLMLPSMLDLRELAIVEDCSFNNYEVITRNLVNLERVFLKYASTNDILPLLRHVPKLKELKIEHLKDHLLGGKHIKNGILDLAALNKERSKLTGASKVTIYVREKIFLATKFAKTNTDLSLITLKRVEAANWTHQFELNFNCFGRCEEGKFEHLQN